MRVLYPDDPLEPRKPEGLYFAEYEAVRARGFQVSLFSFEDFERGRFEPRPRLAAGEPLLYRGWMLNARGYARLAESIAQFSARMLVSPESYLVAHHLPGWYPFVREFTAETLMFEEGTDLSVALANVDWPGYFVKDYVKSLNTGGGSLASTPGEIRSVLSQLKKYRGEIEGGVCIRRREDYVAGSERRYFVACCRAFGSDSEEIPGIVAIAASRIPSPFFSIDVARRQDGELRIIEVGDGQVSDRKEWSTARLVDVLEALWSAPQP